MDCGLSKRVMGAALILLATIFMLYLIPHKVFVSSTKHLLGTAQVPIAASTPGKIQNKVAVITDTQYTPRLIPLILHFHAVLGPDWPIVFFTSEESRENHFAPGAKGSAVWQRAVADKRIEIRTIPSDVDLTHRNAVNLYLSRPWLWEQLAPAQHVLIFQADAMICGNAHRTAEDWLQYDFVGAPFSGPDSPKKYNGGLSLRNRTMILDILSEGNNWEEETKAETWTGGGEDNWFSHKMEARSAHLPDIYESLAFSCQTELHLGMNREPFGFHKVHIGAPNKLAEIAQWCPEIALAAKGTLEPSM
ncbi:hypothetical protein JHW43_004538 [Diplocarpon mali]|nr:hypothetical protein JHW43_004538 [Diplocarpon mali]